MEEFNRAVKKVLHHEGGYVNDPSDPGGETKYGISNKSGTLIKTPIVLAIIMPFKLLPK